MSGKGISDVDFRLFEARDGVLRDAITIADSDGCVSSVVEYARGECDHTVTTTGPFDRGMHDVGGEEGGSNNAQPDHMSS